MGDPVVRYTVEWDVLPFINALKEGFNKKYNLYYLAIGTKRDKEWEVVYIGMTFKQTVSDRLLGVHPKLKSAITDYEDDHWVGLGRVVKRNITPEQLSTIESALISYHKPSLNGVGVGRWTGDRITISNLDVEDSENHNDLKEEFTLH